MQYLIACIFIVGSLILSKLAIAPALRLRERMSSCVPKEVLDIPIHYPSAGKRERVGLKLRQFGEQVLNRSDATLRLTADELNAIFGGQSAHNPDSIEIPPTFRIEDSSVIEQSARTSFWARQVYIKYVRAIQFQGCPGSVSETIRQERRAFRGDGSLLDSGRQTIQNRIQNSYLLSQLVEFCASDRQRQLLISSRIRRAEIEGSTLIFSA